MRIELDGEFKKGFITLAKCRGQIEVDPLGGSLAEKFILSFFEEDIIEALRKKGFKGKVVINGKELLIE